MPPTPAPSRETGMGVEATHLVVQLCLPAQARLSLPRVGPLTVQARLLTGALALAWQAPGDREAHDVGLACGGEAARLVLESRLAVGLVNAVLGLAAPPFAGPLTRIEGGVLAGLLATLAASLGLAPQLRVGVPSGAGPWSTVMELSVGLGGESGRAWLVAPARFLELAWLAWKPGPRARAPRLELATTSVARLEMAGASPGDKVVFDGAPALRAGDDCPVRVEWGGRRAPAWWLADGRLVLRDDDQVAAATATVATLPDCAPRPAADPAEFASGPAIAEVVAGLHCQAFDPARPESLAVSRGEKVALEVDGSRWAEGELGEVDGRLAVTITRMLAE
jgi:hypothetical protein